MGTLLPPIQTGTPRPSVEGWKDFLKEKLWKKDDQQWQANVFKRGDVDDDSIVDGMECCRVFRERYPDTKAWEKFFDYNMCTCFSYSDNFWPINEGLSYNH